MRDCTVRCPFCGGVTDGILPDSGELCGALAPGIGPDHAPRTECFGLKGYVERTEVRLREIEAALKRCGA